jgi:hypothetical protein
MERIIFTKYSNERASQFAVRTDIIKRADETLYVKKVPFNAAAKAHVQDISAKQVKLQEQYQGSRFRFNKCETREDGLELEFLDSKTMEEAIDTLLYKGQVDEAESLILEIVEELYKTTKLQPFHLTDEFVKTFGSVELSEELLCAPISDIDMILGNIMQGQTWEVIDYEWSFAFPIPMKYIAYRLVFYYVYINPTQSILRERDIMGKIGVSEEEAQQFMQMERHFQDIYVLTEQSGEHHTPLRDMYADISAGEIDIRGLQHHLASITTQEDERNNPSLLIKNRQDLIDHLRGKNTEIQEALEAKEHENQVLDNQNKELNNEKEKLIKEIDEYKAAIATMENTKVWKTYRRFKNLTGK